MISGEVRDSFGKLLLSKLLLLLETKKTPLREPSEVEIWR